MNAAAAECDQAFVTLWRRYQHLNLEGNRLLKVGLGKAADTVSKRMVEIEDQIADRPATSHVGLSVKRQLALTLDPVKYAPWPYQLLASALANAVQLTAGGDEALVT